MMPILVKSDDDRSGRKAKAITGGTGVNGLIKKELLFRAKYSKARCQLNKINLIFRVKTRQNPYYKSPS